MKTRSISYGNHRTRWVGVLLLLLLLQLLGEPLGKLIPKAAESAALELSFVARCDKRIAASVRRCSAHFSFYPVPCSIPFSFSFHSPIRVNNGNSLFLLFNCGKYSKVVFFISSSGTSAPVSSAMPNEDFGETEEIRRLRNYKR